MGLTHNFCTIFLSPLALGLGASRAQFLHNFLTQVCDHTCPIQNTKPLRTPKYTPNPPRNRNTEKIRKKIRNWVIFVFFSYFFCISVSRGICGVFRGVFWGSEGFCILYGARMIANPGAVFLKSAAVQDRAVSTGLDLEDPHPTKYGFVLLFLPYRGQPKIRRLFVTCDVFTRYFFVASSWFFRGFFVAFSWPSFWANFTRTRPGRVF